MYLVLTKHDQNQRAVNNRWTGLDWTGLEWTGLEKIVSNTDTDNIGLGWKKGHLKTNITCSIVPPVGEGRVEHNCTWNSHRL